MKTKLTRILSLFLVACLLVGLVGVADAGNRIGTRRALLDVGGQIGYLLRATFSVGDTALNAGDVNTQAPGSVEDGTLTAVETDGTLAIVSNKCAFTAQGTPTWGDQGFYSQAITRALGRALLGTVNLDATNKATKALSLPDTASLATDQETHMMFFLATGYLQAATEDGAGAILENPVVCAYSASTDYQLAIVFGGYDSNGVPWRSGETAANYLYGAEFYIKGGAFTTWTEIWKTAQGNAATLYVAFSNYDAAGTIDNFRVPDADLSDVLQPNNLSTFTAANGTSLDAIVPEVGGAWTEQVGDFDIQGNKATNEAGMASQAIATISTGESDVIIDQVANVGQTVNTDLVYSLLRYTDATHFWGVSIDEEANFIKLYENDGGYTLRASTAVTIDANTDYDLRVIADGQTIDGFVDGGSKLSYGSAAFNETATVHGIRHKQDGAVAIKSTTDNFAIYPRTSSVYDATVDKY